MKKVGTSPADYRRLLLRPLGVTAKADDNFLAAQASAHRALAAHERAALFAARHCAAMFAKDDLKIIKINFFPSRKYKI